MGRAVLHLCLSSLGSKYAGLNQSFKKLFFQQQNVRAQDLLEKILCPPWTISLADCVYQTQSKIFISWVGGHPVINHKWSSANTSDMQKLSAIRPNIIVEYFDMCSAVWDM